MNYAHRSSIRSVPLVVASISAFLALAASVSSASIVYTFSGLVEGLPAGVYAPATDDIIEYNAGVMTFDAALFGATGFSTSSSSNGAYVDASASHNWYASSMNATTEISATTPYLQFTLTPETGESVVVQRFSFGVRALASNDPTEKSTLTTGWPAPTAYAIRSSLDAYGATVASGSFPSNKDTTWYFYDNVIGGGGLQGAVDEDLTLRLYLLDAGTGSRGGAFRIDDVTISAVPEPATFALFGGFVCLGLVLLRRRLHQD